jgi:hypothetical protein
MVLKVKIKRLNSRQTSIFLSKILLARRHINWKSPMIAAHMNCRASFRNIQWTEAGGDACGAKCKR